jgi:hypothetical protein
MPVMRNTALHYRPPVHMVELTTAALAARQVPAKKRVDPPMVRQIGRILQQNRRPLRLRGLGRTLGGLGW